MSILLIHFHNLTKIVPRTQNNFVLRLNFIIVLYKNSYDYIKNHVNSNLSDCRAKIAVSLLHLSGIITAVIKLKKLNKVFVKNYYF
jgi:hypothetical protein